MAFLLTGLLVGCSEKNKSAQGEVQEQTPPAYTLADSALVGTWIGQAWGMTDTLVITSDGRSTASFCGAESQVTSLEVLKEDCPPGVDSCGIAELEVVSSSRNQPGCLEAGTPYRCFYYTWGGNALTFDCGSGMVMYRRQGSYN